MLLSVCLSVSFRHRPFTRNDSPILQKVTLGVRKLNLADYETYHYERDRLKEVCEYLIPGVHDSGIRSDISLTSLTRRPLHSI